MTNRLKVNLLVVLVLQFMIFSSAYAYKKIKCFVLKPPEVTLETVKQIAIMDFATEGASEKEQKRVDSAEKLAYQVLSEILKKPEKPNEINYGRNFTNYLIGELIQKDRGIHRIATGFLGFGEGREGKTFQEGTFTNIYEIIERTQLEKIIEEQALGQSGLMDENQVIAMGKLLNAQALVVGDVSYFHQDKDYTTTREKKKDGKKIQVKVNCKKREVKVGVRLKVISAETGAILASTEADESTSRSQCEDSYGSLPTVNELVDEQLKKLSEKLANYIAPEYIKQDYELEKIKNNQFKDNAEKAAKLAEDLKIDEAYVIYKTIYDQDAYNPEVMYNLGILHEVVGNFQKSKEFYTSAIELKDEGKYKDGLKRVEKNVAFAEALARLGMEIHEHEFTVTEAQQVKALAKKVKTKGKRDERIDVYSQPDAGSQVVTQIPGDLTFTVLNTEGDWFLLQLLGGKQGYVHKDKVEQQ